MVNRGWPPARVEAALIAIARDRETQSPARVAEAGPWWDETILNLGEQLDPEELARLEHRLAETGGVRPLVQRMARAELTAEGIPLTRSTVAMRACAILDRRAAEQHAADPAFSGGATEQSAADREGTR